MEAIATKGCRRGPHGKFTEAELDGIHLVLCNNAEYLIHTCHWEEKYHYEFDKSELREYVSEWQDAVLRNLEARGIDANHITVEYRDRGYHYWNGYRNGSGGGIHAATGLTVVLPEWESKSPHYSKQREPLMRAMIHATCDAHDWITDRIERDLRFSLGQIAAQAIGEFLQEVQ